MMFSMYNENINLRKKCDKECHHEQCLLLIFLIYRILKVSLEVICDQYPLYIGNILLNNYFRNWTSEMKKLTVT